jgi:phosphoadenosine phosphosulfate reductase
MALWRRDGFAENIWTSVADGEALPSAGAIIVSATRWRGEREALSARGDPVGVAIAPGKDAHEHLREATGRPLIALEFPKFADGRAFSLAQLLRQRQGFTSELRAIGEVLLDELALMLRCGFDSFEITNEPTLRALERGWRPGVSLYYQPSLAAREIPAGTRPWLRRAANSAL